MATKTKQWADGSSATIQYGGQGDGQIIITSDPNNHYEARSMQITVETTNGSPKQTKTITINQAARQRIDLSAAVVTASNQTYSGSAKTPTPTVTLNGSTVPSSGYDVAYSNNTNAGTATITITGKGDYTGTASGTFTINKASRTLSFADSYMVLNTSSTGTKTATPSAGSGDGAITYSIANTTYATINSSTGAVTAKTSDGSVIVTATIAEGTNYLSASATYKLYIFATTHDYSYNGSYSNITLPPGIYQFQVWGAQGGSNAALSSYGITARAGGKGGYSIGQLSIANELGIQIVVGGQGGSSGNGGYNGGGSSTGESSYNNGDTFGITKMGGGGGASDIRLNSGSLNSRMIVAGGGSGGAMCFRRVTSTEYDTVTDYTLNSSILDFVHQGEYYSWILGNDTAWTAGRTYTLHKNNTAYTSIAIIFHKTINGQNALDSLVYESSGSTYEFTAPSKSTYPYLSIRTRSSQALTSFNVTITHEESTSTYTDTTQGQVGYYGGGTSGDGISTNYKGRQNAAGSGGSFGSGANQTTTGYRYCSGAGGGGWYGGGGGKYSDSDMNYVMYSGGGSGFVNTAASAGNRPSGYTGLELDSGTTYAGNTLFPAPGGGNETGHSGNGYVRITRLS